ncbi:hypothetical protein BN903_3 [Halorubrum sp. AJ67]|nr:hypothetical protein BN903_3 [Halorubrum sp. AJ67]
MPQLVSGSALAILGHFPKWFDRRHEAALGGIVQPVSVYRFSRNHASHTR